MIDLVVPPGLPPMRLDRFVADRIAGASRRRLRGAAFRLNGRPAKPATPVKPGDIVSIPDVLAPTGDLQPNPEPKLPILHQDIDLVAIDKPPGLASVALRADELETVANFLLAAFPETRTAGRPLEAGLLHRLDHDTSGVLVAALNADAYANLRRQFSSRRVEKEYVALVVGDVGEARRIDAPIAHDRRHQDRMIVCAEARRAQDLRARPASTRLRPVVRYGRATLVQVSMRTGVRHQIRVHLAFAGHPILGDRIYGAPAENLIRRHALHACRVKLAHPTSGEPLTIESRLPPDFEAALKRLKK